MNGRFGQRQGMSGFANGIFVVGYEGNCTLKTKVSISWVGSLVRHEGQDVHVVLMVGRWMDRLMMEIRLW